MQPMETLSDDREWVGGEVPELLRTAIVQCYQGLKSRLERLEQELETEKERRQKIEEQLKLFKKG